MSDNIILIIDSDERSARTAKDAMQSMCENPIQIVSDLEKAKAMLTNQSVVFVIIDLSLHEKDGLELIKWLRQNLDNPNYKAPVLALASLSTENIRNNAINAGVTEYLSKPVSPSAFKDATVSILRNPRHFIVAEGIYIGPDRRTHNDREHENKHHRSTD